MQIIIISYKELAFMFLGCPGQYPGQHSIYNKNFFHSYMFLVFFSVKHITFWPKMVEVENLPLFGKIPSRELKVKFLK